MSINSASYIAYSSLMATQVQMTVASSNIANADTTGYTEETANQAPTVTGGVGAGVTITGITGTVDKLLMKSLVGAASTVGGANTLNTYLNQLQQLYGSTGSANSSGTSLGNSLASLETALSSLANDPGSAAQQAAVVAALQTVTSQLNQTSNGIQTLRGNADQDIGTAVKDVNQQLQTIANLNTQIVQLQATGQSTANLVDQRNAALQDVASKMDVSYFTASNGSLQVYTASGQALVDTAAHTLSYTPAASVTAGTTYSTTPPSGFGGIMLNGQDITSQIKSGSIGALINLRDNVLPGAQAQLDQLATSLQSSVNAVHNAGTSVPPPATLTGTATVSASTPLSPLTGTVRLAVATSAGNLVSSYDLNLATVSGSPPTVGDLVSAINGTTSTSGVSASISNGHLLLSTAASGDGVAINEMTSSIGAGEGLSDYFGLNDLLTGTGASNLAVRSDIAANPGLLATATLSSSASPSVGSQVLSSGSATVANNLSSALTGSTSFSSVAGLGATTTSFASYAADIVASVASQASQASSNYTSQQSMQSAFKSSMSSESGVNLDQETARLSTLQNQYTASAELLQVINQMFSALMSSVQAAAA
ncbi:flagellar hook-associated protein FlgK [Bradyrhizobium sp. U87765 SZCCT0131]|uniref:flagellar hook-associated protein FlgK n=1 Tax=unclassified Bradyrhizobium TaxID=2631580 RepID=UPI001BA513BA|nr:MULTISPECIES: flagellar hook-associated protein FlgK [unclassified Bradyrhizobium]MBR1220949.1 flagellar hook-associated protein FlgK [Bradyrhizobium sp. U87765 SZCCT0131]MBR1260231.1 flagellar hook-associated protein FlgK [Bradyrhizobium sp. U87765 SZCCT0134]MBR1307520.1 flagellar hook-associated protein FlgK [Bradyrhizobium sp. U87765 SZCCT0110]MBR1321474.1 flagellar hook-associated protein FlgK [Bradyrhizobium sp. U87765 SZCCT0109]MBR1349787.1 flagellar hook-associated protein FlgK [Brad